MSIAPRPSKPRPQPATLPKRPEPAPQEVDGFRWTGDKVGFTAGGSTQLTGVMSRALQKSLHKLVDHIVSYGTNPASWPLTQQEQIDFIRRTMWQAQEIKKTHDYVASALALAASEAFPTPPPKFGL